MIRILAILPILILLSCVDDNELDSSLSQEMQQILSDIEKDEKLQEMAAISAIESRLSLSEWLQSDYKDLSESEIQIVARNDEEMIDILSKRGYENAQELYQLRKRHRELLHYYSDQYISRVVLLTPNEREEIMPHLDWVGPLGKGVISDEEFDATVKAYYIEYAEQTHLSTDKID